VSRGKQCAGSDLGIYDETSDLALKDQRADPDSRWHVLGVPSGALLQGVRHGNNIPALVVDVDQEQQRRPHRC
jgi:hypothetical protein